MSNVAGGLVARHRLLVLGCIAIVLAVCFVGGILGGGYALSLSAIRQNNATQAQLQIRENESAVRTSIPTCEALIALDDARNGATFPHYPGAKPGQGYGQRLAAAIDQVVDATKCKTLIYDVDHHWSVSRIERQLHELG